MAKDFPSKQPTPQNPGAVSRSPEDQGGAEATGFNDAPLVPQDRGGAGAGVPANKRTIR